LVFAQYREASYSTSLSNNRWYHVAFTYKSGEGIKLYVDGKQVSSVSQSGFIQSSAQPVYIGWFDFFKGKIDEVKIYPTRLTSQQISQDYLQSASGLSNSLSLIVGSVQNSDTIEHEVIPNDSVTHSTSKASNSIALMTAALASTDLIVNQPIRYLASDDENLIISCARADNDPYPESEAEVRLVRNYLVLRLR
jgi:hypothetical protein